MGVGDGSQLWRLSFSAGFCFDFFHTAQREFYPKVLKCLEKDKERASLNGGIVKCQEPASPVDYLRH